MTLFEHQSSMKSFRSGECGERFCKEQFGITEGKHYEIKSNGNRRGMVILQAWQLLDQLGKQYVILRYERDSRRLTKGVNKGKQVFTQTIEEAYAKNQIKVCVVSGYKLMKVILENKLICYCTAKGGDILKYGKWGIVFRIPIKLLWFDDDFLIEETERYKLYALPDDPPGWISHVGLKQEDGTFNFDEGAPF